MRRRDKWATKLPLTSASAPPAYVLYSIIFHDNVTVYRYMHPLPTEISQALTLVMAIFVFLGSSPTPWASAFSGASLIIVHLQMTPAVGILGAVIGAFILTTKAAHMLYLRVLKEGSAENI